MVLTRQSTDRAKRASERDANNRIGPATIQGSRAANAKAKKTTNAAKQKSATRVAAIVDTAALRAAATRPIQPVTTLKTSRRSPSPKSPPRRQSPSSPRRQSPPKASSPKRPVTLLQAIQRGDIVLKNAPSYVKPVSMHDAIRGGSMQLKPAGQRLLKPRQTASAVGVAVAQAMAKKGWAPPVQQQQVHDSEWDKSSRSVSPVAQPRQQTRPSTLYQMRPDTAGAANMGYQQPTMAPTMEMAQRLAQRRQAEVSASGSGTESF